jgi:branched-chain amino acid transport system ATP-binding protein
MKAPLLEVVDISKSFGGLLALDQVSFEVPESQILSLIGPNGAGKTTLFNIIRGFMPPAAGDIRFKGRSLKGLKPHDIAALGISTTFQLVQLFTNMSVVENVMVGCHLSSRTNILQAALRLPPTSSEEQGVFNRAMKELALVGLEGRALEPCASLPVGQQRLVELARSLATEPILLLLDEPFSGLSAEENESLIQHIDRLLDNGVTVLLVEHQMQIIMRISDRVVVLDRGVKIAEGTPSQVCSDNRVIVAYLGEETTQEAVRNGGLE